MKDDWRADLVAKVPRDEIPAFLTDLQGLVQALREGGDWEARITPRLRAWPGLVLEFIGPGQDAVAAALTKRP